MSDSPHESANVRGAAHSAITRALDEAGVRNEVLRGMCIEVGLETFDEARATLAASPATLSEAPQAEALPLACTCGEPWRASPRGMFHYTDGRPCGTPVVPSGAPQADRDAAREEHSKVIKALAAIVNVSTPDDLFDRGAIPREPVMTEVVRIRDAADKLGRIALAAEATK